MIFVERYVGEREQIPPMYSAVKVDGVKMYDLARKGQEVERKPKKITIHNLKVEHYEKNEGIMRVACSKGTYIRTLIHDIGQDFGTGGIMTSLCRTKSGVFTLEDCVELDDVRDIAANEGTEALRKLLMPLDRLFEVYPKARLDETQSHLFRNGVILAADRIRLDKVYSGIYTVYSHDRILLALATIAEDHSLDVLQRFSAGGAIDDEHWEIEI
jgi:tRNA pseudouridine55 synthase